MWKDKRINHTYFFKCPILLIISIYIHIHKFEFYAAVISESQLYTHIYIYIYIYMVDSAKSGQFCKIRLFGSVVKTRYQNIFWLCYIHAHHLFLACGPWFWDAICKNKKVMV